MTRYIGMKNHVFLSFILLLMTVFLHLFSILESHFSGTEEYKLRISMMSEELDMEKLKLQISEYKFREYRQEVASVIPQVHEKYKNKNQYSIRNLASINQKAVHSRLGIKKAQQIFLKAKSFFRKNDYTQANREFSKIIRHFSFSIYVVESQFLMAEGYFQLREFDKAVGVVDQLLTQHPGHELTGFAMLRLGQIFEFQDRTEEAEGIYKTIMQSFSNDELVHQSYVALRTMKL